MFAEVECWPFWDDETGDNVDPVELGLSDALVASLSAWSDELTRVVLGNRDPAASGFKSPGEEAAWEAEGLRLWGCVRVELGTRAVVTYPPLLEVENRLRAGGFEAAREGQDPSSAASVDDLKRRIEVGIAELRRGEGVDGEEFFARLAGQRGGKQPPRS